MPPGGDLRCDVQVAHYPPGCSKYNPIEHRLFCHVSRSLQAVVLKTIACAQFISRTTTTFGLRVVTEIARHIYEKGIQASRHFLDNNPIVSMISYPNSTTQHRGSPCHDANREVILRSFLKHT